MLGLILASAALASIGSLALAVSSSKRRASAKYATAEAIRALLASAQSDATTNDDDDDVVVTLLDTSDPGQVAEEQHVTAESFRTKDGFVWCLAKVTDKDAQFTVIEIICQTVRAITNTLSGFYLVAKDRNGNILASARVAYHSPSMFGDLNELPGFGPVFRHTVTLGLCGRVFVSRMLRMLNLVEDTRKQCMQTAYPNKTYLHLMQLATHPKYQGKGAGTKLLAQLERIAAMEKMSIYLETDTERLSKYYGRNGYDIVAEYIVPDSEDPFKTMYGMIHPGGETRKQ